MSSDFEVQFDNESAYISGEVILQSLGQMLEYYPLVLGSALRMLCEISGKTPSELLLQLEQEHGLVGVLESSHGQLVAGREVLSSLIQNLPEA